MLILRGWCTRPNAIKFARTLPRTYAFPTRFFSTHRYKPHRVPNHPPRRDPRQHDRPQAPDSGGGGGIPPDALFYGIMIANGAVFLAWGFANSLAGDPTLCQWMADNFTSSYRNLASGRIWTLLTACFSHQTPSHILFNGITYFFFAKPLLHVLGSARFLSLYLGGGVTAALVSIFYHTGVRRDYQRSSLGASGAIYALLSFVTCLRPTTTVYLYYVVPLPIWLVVSGIVLYDGYMVINDKKTQTDGVGHISGLAVGVCYYLFKRFGVR